MKGEFAFSASLEENSPFIPFDYVSGQQPELPIGPQRGGVELRGILDFGDVPRFSLYNTKTQKSVWVNFKDKEAPYYIDSYDPQKKLIAITINGLRQQLQVSMPSEDGARGGNAARGSMNLSGEPSKNETEAADDEEDEDDTEEDLPEDEQAQKRREMSEKVYKAFQQYVSEKRGEAPAP